MANREFAKRIGKQLQEARRSAGFKSAKAFAEHIGYSPSAYTEYEQGRRMFTYEQAWEFCDVLGCTMDELGGRKPPERAYSDPRQAQLNASYENMNDNGRDSLAAVARSMEKDTANRTFKDSAERVDDQTAMGA